MIVYVTSQGSNINIEGGKIVISEVQGLKRFIPKEQIEILNIFGNVHITTKVIQHFLQRAIPINYFSFRGQYFGRLYTSSSNNIFRLKKQINASENTDFSLEMAKIFIKAKVNNQNTILRRYERKYKNNKNIINNISIMQRKIENTKDISQLMGIEGYVARLYFNGISNIISEDFKFKGRNKRPPKDPFNSLLSLGYSILLNEITGNLEAVGLNPFCGFLHQDKERHLSLASDIIEEFRAPIVDSLALNLCNNKFKIQDFSYEDGGVYLKENILKIYIEELEKKLMKEQNYREDIKAISFRKAIYLQCRDLVNSIEELNPKLYKALWLR